MNTGKSVAPWLLLLLTIFWLLLAIKPLYRDIWFAENILLIIGVGFLISTYKSMPLSNTAYWLLFIFCILQTIGAHYSYKEVPLGFWIAELLDFERNHYDRLVHFAFGFLLVLPVKEVASRSIRFATAHSEWVIIVLVFLGLGALYEVLEWWYALYYEQEVQTADMFLGSQGDIWDAEKDIFLGGLGAGLFLLLARLNKR